MLYVVKIDKIEHVVSDEDFANWAQPLKQESLAQNSRVS